MGDAWRALLAALWPPACAGCGGAQPRGGALCDACNRRLPRLPAPARGACRLCQTAPALRPHGACAACASSRSPLEACVAAAPYEGDVLRWIQRFKYPRPGLAGLDPAARAVARMLAREAGERAPGGAPGWVVPVPLHPRRLRERGFNPAALLARDLARDRARTRWAPRALRRTRDTPSQTGLGRRERGRNVRGAFEARPGAPPPGRVWLVDDVVTTGATLAEAARALRRAGAREVIGICAARTPAAGLSASDPPSPRSSRTGAPDPRAS